jgi:hypothetical protein
MAPNHPEGFLKLVNDAKKHIKEENFRATKKRLDAGEKFILVDTRGLFPIRMPRLFFTAAEDSVPLSPPTISRKWATRTSSRWMAAGAAGPKPIFQ